MKIAEHHYHIIEELLKTSKKIHQRLEQQFPTNAQPVTDGFVIAAALQAYNTQLRGVVETLEERHYNSIVDPDSV